MIDFNNLRARAAAGGWALTRHEIDGTTSFTLSRWGMVKTLHSLEDVGDFLRRVMGVKL